jgi:hypothetical protein
VPGYKHVDVPAIERELQEVAKVPWEHVCANTSEGQERLRKGSRRFQMEFRWNSYSVEQGLVQFSNITELFELFAMWPVVLAFQAVIR